jgi:hypothetical protein
MQAYAELTQQRCSFPSCSQHTFATEHHGATAQMHAPTHHSDRMYAGPGQGGQSHWPQRNNVEEGRVGAHNISDALEAALAPVSLQYNLSFQVSRSLSLATMHPCRLE